MKNKKIIVIIISILIIFVIGILTLIIILNKNKNNAELPTNVEEEEVPEDEQGEYYYDKIILKDTSKIKIMTISECVSAKTNNYYFVNEAYTIRDSEGTVYFTKGKQQNQDKYYIVCLDGYNHTYSVEETDQSTYDNMLQGNIDEKYKQEATVEDIGDNNFITIILSDSNIANMYFDIIKNLLNSEPEVLYDLLDSEYQQKRFGNIESFMEYVNDNKNKFANIQISKYAKYTYDDYIQYVCLDTNDEYYIINEDTTTGDYKILLDTYTIDQPEFIEKYDSASDIKKAGYDIDKFMQAINAHDYTYAYNCLAESYKQNNFTTINSFRNYIQNNFYSKNNYEIKNGTKEGDYYVYTVNITDAEQDTSGLVQKNFIVNIKDNREFELSFNVE